MCRSVVCGRFWGTVVCTSTKRPWRVIHNATTRPVRVGTLCFRGVRFVKIGIVNWDKFQVYKDSRPMHWIKVHRELLTKHEWRLCPPEAAKFLIDLWLLASRGGDSDRGTIDISAQDISWEIREPVEKIEEWLNILEKLGFVNLVRNRTDPYETVRSHARSREKIREEKIIGENGTAPVGAAVPLFLSRLGKEWDLKTDIAVWSDLLQNEFPAVNFDAEVAKCGEWWESEIATSTRKFKKPSQAIRNWLKNADKFLRRDSAGSTLDTGSFDPEQISSV